MTTDAGSTKIVAVPQTQTAQPGSIVTVDVIAKSVSGDIGAQNITITISDPSVGTITDATVLGDPGQQSIAIAGDGSSASLIAALMQTPANQDVTIAQLELELVNVGTTSVTPSVDELTDESGLQYTITDTTSETIEATDPGFTVSTEDITPDGTTTVDIQASDATDLSIKQLWSDWEISEIVADGGSSSITPPNTPDNGAVSLSWDTPQVVSVQLKITPNANVTPDPTYVGGEYVLTISLNGGTDTIEESFIIQ